MTHVKICGITRVVDATESVKLGANAIGLNFVAASPRCITVERAREIARAIHGMGTRLLVVGVVADLGEDELRALVKDAELDCLQLHGDEPPDALIPFLPHAYKAVRIATAQDVARARTYPGEHLLVDAKVEGALGGTGASFDWTLVKDLARERKLTLAGGLHPDNVARAVHALSPYCVDVASGVESAPGVKDLEKVRAFITNARSARTQPR
jgi:phosphoribosylanthranilate isomerase